MRLTVVITLVLFLGACKPNRSADNSLRPDQSNTTGSGSVSNPAISPATSAIVLSDSIWQDSVDYWLDPVVTLRDSIATVLRSLPAEGRDSAFAILLEIYDARANEQAASLFDTYPFQQWVENSYIPAQMAGTKGFIMHSSEGFYYLIPDHKALNQSCGNLLSPSMRNYLDFRGKEDSTGFSNDATLLISWDELAARILWIDDFLQRNLQFPFAHELSMRRQLYVSTYLTGMDNSPVFSHFNRKVEPAVLASYNRVINEHPATKLSEIVKSYLVVLKKSDYSRSQLVYDYWKKNSVEH